MNDIKPNEPFNAEEKKHIVNKKSESYVKYNGEDIPVDYKTDINLAKNNSKNSPSNEITFSAR